MGMKTATKVIRSVEPLCPYCEQTIPTSGGDSLFWTTEELQEADPAPVECPSCFEKVKLPRIK